MKKVDSQELLESLESQVEIHIQLAVKVFQNIHSEKLLQPYATGGWSIAQCLEHLNTYGHFYLPQIKNALEENKSKPYKKFFKSGWLGWYFTRMMDPSSGKKYKAFKGYNPINELNTSEVVAEFIEQQEVLLKYLFEARSVNLNVAKVPVSIVPFVRLKLGDVFQFLIAHNERHIQQAKRNLELF